MLLDLSRQIVKDIQSTLEKTGQSLSQGQVHQLLQSALAKQGLVTREEFDAQKAVLLRTREKVEALERRVEALAANSKPKTDANPSANGPAN